MRIEQSTSLVTLLAAGCLNSFVPTHKPGATPSQIHDAALPNDLFVTLKNPSDAHAELCANDGMHPKFPNDADLLTKQFCQDLVPGGKIPSVTSLADLQKLFGLDFKNPSGENGAGGNPGFAILGHSSALTARKVSTLTPTVFVFTPPPPDGTKPSGFIFLAFDPGEEFVEIASHDPTADVVNFYLVLFDKDCNKSAGGCSNADLLSSRHDVGWSNVRQYESSTFLNNTIADCRECHAPDNSKPPILRMQEIEAPFTHWFSQNTEGGRALLADFHAARGGEDYGPIPAAMIDKSDPALMAKMVTQAGFGQQPNAFPSAQIEADTKQRYALQPAVNDPPGWSAAWQTLYDAAAQGQFIAAPYHDVKVTDAAKLSANSDAYRRFASGARADLPDLRDVFLDAGLRDMGFAPKLGADGRSLLRQMCQQCHHSRLDPTLSREKFLVDQLDTMSRAEKDVAVDRMRLDPRSRLFMPPRLFRTITDDERDLMIAELQR